MQLDVIRPAVAEEALPPLEQLRAQLSEISDGLRTMAHRLHPPQTEHLGLAAALESLIREHRTQGLHLGTEMALKLPRVSPLASIAVYRIAQEALWNASKHAGGARVTVTLQCHEGQIHLNVRDHGPGFSLSQARRSGGMGLASMRERAELAGGTLEVRAQKGRGTCIHAIVPMCSEGSAAGERAVEGATVRRGRRTPSSPSQS